MLPLAEHLRASAAELSSAVVRQIQEESPDLFPRVDDFEENRAATEANITLFAELVAEGREPREAEWPSVAVAYVREGVHRGLPLAAFLHSLRLGHAAVWRSILAQLEERTEDWEEFAAAVDLASAWLFAYVDVLSRVAEETYTLERERWLRTAAAVRTETIESILHEREIDAGSAALRLGYELEREHVAVIGWYEDAEEGRDTIAALEAAIGELAGRLGSTRPLIEPLGLLAVAAWVGSQSGFNDAALDGLRADGALAPDARLALGEPAYGIAGFRSSHQEALQARRVAGLAARPPGTITRYRTVAVSAMATADIGQARAFVERELRGLSATDDQSVRLRETLQIFLEEGASHSRTAKRLGIHENTVRYRVKQTEEMLGRTVQERRLDLGIALVLLGVVYGDGAR